MNPNAEAIEAWNTILFDKFIMFRHLLCDALAKHGTEAMKRHPPRTGDRVLDVGCGFGDTARELATIVGPEGEVVGVDCAPRFVEAAAREAAAAGVTNVRFLAADVQLDDLEGPYALAYSRFGTMFFNSPVAALRNIRRSLVEGGQLVMAVWRSKQANPWAASAEECVRRFVAEEDKDRSDVTRGPGPFSMAGPDLVSDQLQSAGFREVSFTRFDAPLCIGRSLDEAIDFSMTLGPAGEVMRLGGAKAEARRPQIIEAMREMLAVSEGADGVCVDSSAWIIHARAGV